MDAPRNLVATFRSSPSVSCNDLQVNRLSRKKSLPMVALSLRGRTDAARVTPKDTGAQLGVSEADL
eukprot:CAMPEP_0115560190 /NCGR_PEP_ID=MMETSP0271-20121206/100344_1 /TAXON_ID=71861 /ORGANISM="Scrippsiella trochoidea, Strain CCMP3099" /LENGTH=65 /DNA_ID=CAMNT_0002994265 /DNA_START=701 /DNA_END=898 /DNA_ORIENTATION=-